jgi:hypothetical protein
MSKAKGTITVDGEPTNSITFYNPHEYQPGDEFFNTLRRAEMDLIILRTSLKLHPNDRELLKACEEELIKRHVLKEKVDN